MNERRRLDLRGIGSGLAAALVLLAASLAIRAAFGVGTVAELGSDRVAPFLSIPIFFKMLGIFGGYSHLKELGVTSFFGGELFAGAFAGLLLSRIAGARSTAVARRFVNLMVGVVTLLLIAFLWPQLGANYHGLPPSPATFASVVTLLGLSALFLVTLFAAEGSGASAREAEPAVPARRRSFVVGAVAATAALISGGLLTRFFRMASYNYDGTQNLGEDLPPITPNDAFYMVTKNNVDPRPIAGEWALEIGGAVSKPVTLRLDDLRAMPSVVQETTLQCISNQIGGGLSSNAIWKGVPLQTVLRAAGVSSTIKQVAFRGADGFLDDLPPEKALDPHTLLVYEMNGKPLPQVHGYPVRLLVPGYVGEKSVKWLTRIEPREVPLKGFYETQGWGPQFTINNTSRFDAPDFGDDNAFHVGQRTVIKGTAFAGDRGVQSVQVSTDDAHTWQNAEITYQGSDLSWVQWRFPWKPDAAGDVTLWVRCIDKQGHIQQLDFKPSGPEPVKGSQSVQTTVAA